MRLTLRAMLAYLDENLEPTDAEDVGKKIEESEFATGLLNRIRDVTRRLRLGAPKLDGKGMGLDANTVGEYLDHTLPAERVPDFEKVCLESDTHLAEVASAHQILTLVLGTPAEIEPGLREKMYALPQLGRAKAGAAGTSAAGEAKSPGDGKPVAETAKTSSRSKRRRKRRKVAVPEYLRDETAPRRGRKVMLAGLLLALAFVGTALLLNKFPFPGQVANVPPKQQEQVGDTKASPGSTASPSGAPTKKKSAAKKSAERDRTETNTEEQLESNDDGESERGTTADDVEQPGAKVEPATDDTQRAPDAEPAETNEDDGGKKKSSKPTARVVRPVDEEEVNSAAPDGAPEAPLPDDDKLPADRIPSDERPRPDDMPEAASGDKASGDKASGDKASGNKASGEKGPNKPVGRGGKPAQQTETDNDEIGPKQPVAAEGIGRLVSEKQVLLGWEHQLRVWNRLPSRQTIYAGERLLALPTYQPQVALAVGVTAQIQGGSLIELLPSDEAGVPGVSIHRGRLILLTVGRPDTSVRLQAGDVQGTLTFGKDDATVALEVARRLPDGADPETEEAAVETTLYVAQGAIHWTAGDEAAEVITGPAQLAFGAQPPVPQTIEKPPAWIDSVPLTDAERKYSSPAVETALRLDVPVSLKLQELLLGKRVENVRLAFQCLAQMDEFEPLVPMLNDQIQKNSFEDFYESLRSALTRGPEVAAKLRAAFELHRGKDKGDTLFRLLWGFNRQQLESGDAATLVAGLKNDDLDIRVLSILNLKRVAGTSRYYQPTDPEKKRLQAVRQWEQKLQAKQILPKEEQDSNDKPE